MGQLRELDHLVKNEDMDHRPFRRALSIVALMLLLSGVSAWAQNALQDWKMPETDLQKWALRLKKLCRSYEWTVTAKGNDIIMERDKPVMFGRPINGPTSESSKGPRIEGIYRITLRFAPEMSLDEYEKLKTENEASDLEDQKLKRKHNISTRFGGTYASGDDAKKREQAYREEFEKLVYHRLPHFYAPQYSITYYHSWRWFEYLDSGDADVDEECNGIKEAITKYFGTYNYLVAIGSSDFGYQEAEDKK